MFPSRRFWLFSTMREEKEIFLQEFDGKLGVLWLSPGTSGFDHGKTIKSLFSTLVMFQVFEDFLDS